METSQARLYAGPHVQSSDRLRRKEPNRGDKQLFLVSLVSDPTPQIAATPANRRLRRRSDRGKKTASIDSATFSHCADGHRETPSGCWFPTTSSSSHVLTQLNYALRFFSVSCFFLFPPRPRSKSLRGNMALDFSLSYVFFFSGKNIQFFLKSTRFSVHFRAAVSRGATLVIRLQMCFTLLRGGELERSTTSTTTSPPRRCRDASLCASRWRMAGILIRPPSLACTCGANVPAGFWRDKLASAGSSFSPPLTPRAPPWLETGSPLPSCAA